MDSKTDNLVSFKFGEYQPKSDAEKLDRKGWVAWGVDNLFPQYLTELAQSSPVHGALVVAIGDMIAGKGVKSEQYDADLERLNVSETVYGCAHDYKKFGGYYIEVIYSTDGSGVAKLNHIPFEECRIAVEEETDAIVGVFHSLDWENPRKKKNTPTFVPIYNPVKASSELRQMHWCFTYTGSQTYPRPDYWSAVNYIELDRNMGIYHVNNIMNGLFPSFIISFFNGQATPEQKTAMLRDWENKLSGARNAGKFYMTFNERETPKPEITTFPLSDADKQYQVLENTAQQKVIVAHRVTTPLLFGIRDTGTGFGSNKDEMATGLEIFKKQVIEPAQRKITESLELILSEQLPNVVFDIVPNTPLAEEIAAPVESKVPGATNTGGPVSTDVPSENVAATALNGAQITGLVEIIKEVVMGTLPVPSGKAVVKAAFPTLTDAQVEGIFNGVGPNPTLLPEQQALHAFNDDDLTALAPELIRIGHDPDPDWILVDEYEIPDPFDDEDTDEIQKLNFAAVSSGTARPNATSEQDKKIDGVKFYTRYVYSGPIQDNTRPFCREMLKANKLYRKEDVMQLTKKVVNPRWGPYGANTYSVWLFKGGGNCGHVWKKRTYASAKGFGLDLNNPNIKEATSKKISEAGYKVRNNPKVEQRPIDMPYNGFMPDNPRFGKK